MVGERTLTAGEWSVLALLCEEPAHGWALAAALAPDGEIGVVWSLSRPLVYRALEILHERGLVEVVGAAASTRGPSRVVHRPTRKGRARVGRWLAEPVDHVRDLRPDLLLKLVFAERAGVDTAAMLAEQGRVIEAIVAGLDEKLERAHGGLEVLVRYRAETARAALRFVESAHARAG